MKNFCDWLYKTTSSILTVKSLNKPGVAVGSLLGPSLANTFLSFYEQIWLTYCPEDFKTIYYTRYIENISTRFTSLDHLEKFTNYLNSKHKNIKLTYEKESNNSLAFLDILISKSESSFETSVYHKPSFSGVYSNFNSFIYGQY